MNAGRLLDKKICFPRPFEPIIRFKEIKQAAEKVLQISFQGSLLMRYWRSIASGAPGRLRSIAHAGSRRLQPNAPAVRRKIMIKLFYPIICLVCLWAAGVINPAFSEPEKGHPAVRDKILADLEALQQELRAMAQPTPEKFPLPATINEEKTSPASGPSSLPAYRQGSRADRQILLADPEYLWFEHAQSEFLLDPELRRAERLSIEEREARSKKEGAEKRIEQTTRENEDYFTRSLEKGGLKTHWNQLKESSEAIARLKAELKAQPEIRRDLLIDLGKAYLKSQRHLMSLETEDRIRLIDIAQRGKIVLGSYEISIWAFKRALEIDASDGETRLILGEIFDELGDGETSAAQVRQAMRIFSGLNLPEKESLAQGRLESLNEKYKLFPKENSWNDG